MEEYNTLIILLKSAGEKLPMSKQRKYKITDFFQEHQQVVKIS